MNARRKLNAACFQGAFFVSGVVGLVGQSGWLFVLLFAFLVGLMLMTGDIRLNPTGSERRPRSRHPTSRRRRPRCRKSRRPKRGRTARSR